MTRPLRIQFENAYYHVTCRGNSRQRIFSGEEDHPNFLNLLERSSGIYEVEILAYVLMVNHFHLFVKTPLGNLQEFMRHFNISYTSYYNRKHHRTGHLYQGRYKSFLVDADEYLQEVSRYIHLNPVRVKPQRDMSIEEKVDHLRSYPWSSYKGYLSKRNRDPFVRVEEVLAHFGGDTPTGRRRYEGFVIDGLSRGMSNPLERGKGHGIVGTSEFMKQIKERFIRSAPKAREVPAVRRIIAQVEPGKVIKEVCARFKVNRDDVLKKGYKGTARGVLMEMLYRHAGMNQREIGGLMGVDYSAVSVMRRRLSALQKSDPDLSGKIEKLKDRFHQSQE
jgi:putative transposase